MSSLADRSRRKWWILGAAGKVLALVVLDEIVIGAALPTMRAGYRWQVWR